MDGCSVTRSSPPPTAATTGCWPGCADTVRSQRSVSKSAGSFGATLTRAFTKAGERVLEVNRPNRLARRMDGKSDRLDAEQIARAVLGQTSTAIPKAKSEPSR